MRKFIMSAITAICLLLLAHPLLAMDQPEPIQVTFNYSGFEVQGSSGASQLELRVVDPQRRLLYENRTKGSAISWNLSGNEIDGEYRYEAVTVQKVDGQLKQYNQAGGFEIRTGQLVAPPEPAVIESLK